MRRIWISVAAALGLFGGTTFVLVAQAMANTQKPQKTITVLTPVAGAKVEHGQTVSVTWTGGYSDETLQINLIDVARNAAVSAGTLGNRTNDGHEDFIVPAAVPPGIYQFYVGQTGSTGVHWGFGPHFEIVAKPTPIQPEPGASSTGASGGAPSLARINADRAALLTQSNSNVELRMVTLPGVLGPASALAPAGYCCEHVDIAPRTDGFWATWTDTQSKTIRIQQFDKTGQPVARFNGEAAYSVNTPEGSYNHSPAISAFGPVAANRSLVVWQAGIGGDDVQIRGRRIFHDGRYYGDTFKISGDAAVNTSPDVARLSKGRAVVVWESGAGIGTSQPADIYARIIAPPTEPQPPIIQVTSSAGAERDASVFAVGDGFAVLWREGDAQTGALKTQRYDAAGAPVGAIIAVTPNGSFAYGHERGDAAGVELADGTFVILWPSADNSIYGRRFKADGTAMGDAVPLSTSNNVVNRWPAIERTAAQSVLVAWEANGEVFVRMVRAP